jgi:hypothetical protein
MRVITVSYDGTLAALWSSTGLQIRRTADGSLYRVVATCRAGVQPSQAVFSRDNRRIALAYEPDTVLDILLEEEKIAWRTGNVHVGYKIGYLGSALLFRHQSEAESRSYLMEDGKLTHPAWLDEVGHLYALSPDGQRLVFTNKKRHHVWDLATNQVAYSVETSSNQQPIWYGSYLATNTSDSLELHAPKALPIRIPFDHRGPVVVTPDGQYLRAVQEDGLLEWTLADKSFRAIVPRKAKRKLQRDGMVLEQTERYVDLRKGLNGPTSIRVVSPTLPWSTAVTSRGELLLLTENDRREQTLSVVLPIPPSRSLRLVQEVKPEIVSDPKRPRVALFRGTHVWIYDTESLAQLRKVALTTEITQLRFRGSQNELVVLHDNQLSFVDLENDAVRTVALRASGSFDSTPKLLRVSPSGNHVVAHSPFAVGAYLWSAQGVVKLETDSSVLSAAFSADERTVRLATAKALYTYTLADDLKPQRVPHHLSCVLEPSLDDGTIPCPMNEGFAALSSGDADFRAISLPTPSIADQLSFEGGTLQARVSPNLYVKWRPGGLRASAPFTEAQDRLSASSDVLPEEHVIKSRWLDGEVALTKQNTILRKGEPKLRIPYRSDETFLGFAGASRSLLVADVRGLAVFELEPPYTRNRIADFAAMVAQSDNFRSIAVTSNHGRSLRILRAPEWKPFGAPIALNGVRTAAFGPGAVEVAALDESGQLWIYDTSRPSKPPEGYLLDPKIGVFGIQFDPNGRFLYLGGSPIRIIRRRDGKQLSMYVGLLDHGRESEATLLFRDETGSFEGDPRLAKSLFCRDVLKSCPAMSNGSDDVVSRFFETTAESKPMHPGAASKIPSNGPAVHTVRKRNP